MWNGFLISLDQDVGIWLLSLLIVSLVLFFMVVHYHHQRPDLSKKDTLPPLRHRPSNLSPALVATLLEERVGIRSVLALFFDLAQQKYLSIAEEPSENWADGRRDFRLVLEKEVQSLPMPAKTLLGGMTLLSAGDSVRLSKLRESLHNTVVETQRRVHILCSEMGFFDLTKQHLRMIYALIGLLPIAYGLVLLLPPPTLFPPWPYVITGAAILIFLSLFVFLLPLERGQYRHFKLLTFPLPLLLIPFAFGYSMAPTLEIHHIRSLLGACGLASLIIWSFGSLMPLKTWRGQHEQKKWLAFRKSLETLDPEESLDDPSGLFERYLGYAIAFGIEAPWMMSFEEHDIATPAWYRPHAGSADEEEWGTEERTSLRKSSDGLSRLVHTLEYMMTLPPKPHS